MKLSYLTPTGQYRFFQELVPFLESRGVEVCVNSLPGDADAILCAILPITHEWLEPVRKAAAASRRVILWDWDHFEFCDTQEPRWREYLNLLTGGRCEVWACGHELARQLLARYGVRADAVVAAWVNCDKMTLGPEDQEQDYVLYAIGGGGLHKRPDWAETACRLLGLPLKIVANQSLPRQEYVSVVKRCRVYLMPAFDEGNASIPALEAQAAGRRIVCSDLPACREVLGEHAYYFNPWSFGGLKDHLFDAWYETGAFNELGRQRARALYDLPVVAGQVLKLLRGGEPVHRPGLGDETGRVLRRGPGWLEYRHAPGHGLEVVHIEVEPGERGRGVGTSLVRGLIESQKPRCVYGFVQAGNARAQNFYNRQGFSLISLPDFYGPGSDAYMFHKVTS